MMRLPVIAGAILVLLSASGCGSVGSPVDSENIIVIDLEDKIRYYPSMLFDSIHLIPMETNSESVFSECRKLIITDDYYYIRDGDQYNILAFDKNGTFKFSTINLKGRGPGEYLSIIDFDINPFTGNMEILEPFGRIAVYNPEAKFIEYHRLPPDLLPLGHYKVLTEDVLIFHAGVNAYQDKALLFYSLSQGEVVGTDLRLPQQLKHFPHFNTYHRFYYYMGELYFTYNYMNQVLKICPEELSSGIAVSVNFSEKTFRPEELPESLTRPEKIYFTDNNMGRYAFVDRIFETATHIWTFFYYSDGYGQAKVNKLDNSITTIFGRFGEKYLLPPPHAFDDNSLYYVSEPSHLPYYIDPEWLDSRNQEIYNSINPDDNPVMIRFFF